MTFLFVIKCTGEGADIIYDKAHDEAARIRNIKGVNFEFFGKSALDGR